MGDVTALRTNEMDAVLSKIDACEEVGRAKGEFFKEQQE